MLHYSLVHYSQKKTFYLAGKLLYFLTQLLQASVNFVLEVVEQIVQIKKVEWLRLLVDEVFFYGYERFFFHGITFI